MKISDVSKEFGLSLDTLRYYEKAGLIPAIKKDATGVRNYSDWDRRWVGFIKCMRDAGLPVDVLVEYVRLFQQGDTTREARKTLLVDQRAKLAARIDEMQKTLARLDYKIAVYDEQLLEAESALARE